jgi:hypothetical protein
LASRSDTHVSDLGPGICAAGEWHVIMACRDFLKAERMARKAGISKDNYTTLHLDLSSLESVRQFVDNFRWESRILTASATYHGDHLF